LLQEKIYRFFDNEQKFITKNKIEKVLKHKAQP